MPRYVIDLEGLLVEEQFYDDGRQSVEADEPVFSDGQTARWTGSGWEIIPDHRGQIVCVNGKEVFWDKVGALPEGVCLAESGTVDLTVAKAVKITALNAAAQQFVNAAAGIDKVPDFELRTWAIQAAEAHAWEADQSVPTPVLDQIAASRGIAADKLKAAALRKALAYEQLTAHIAGQRQALQVKIDSAKTQAALDNIVIEFTAPQAV